jgi:hypothetical protein
MGFLIPSALALAALAIPIIIFYMLKLRRRPAPVSSLLLWQQVLQDRQANAPWQRIKRNLLLLLQLLILALLVLALARPYFSVAASVQGNVVLLLDASASMQATDVTPNRFGQAQATAREIITGLGPGAAVTLIAVENTPRVLASASTDHAGLTRRLNQARPSNGPADWAAALTLAAAAAAAQPETTVVIISDGSRLDEPAAGNEVAAMLANIPAPVEFKPAGSGANNQGVVALSLRDGRDGPQLFVRVFNAGAEPVRRRVEIRIDAQLFEARQLDLPAGGSASLTLSGLPLQARRVQASLAGRDDLAVDDVAWAVRSTAPTRVLLVGQSNLFLERALALLPGLTVQRAGPDQLLPQTPFDLVIFDRVAPAGAELPESNLLFIAPPASTSLFAVSGTISQTRIRRVESSDPLLSYVKLNTVRVGQAQAVTPPPWGRTLIEAEGGPLLIAGQAGSRRVAILAFDLHHSDLPLQIDFPLLMVNLARWLLPGDNLSQGQSLRANQSFDLPGAASADQTLIRTPGGSEISIPADQTAFAGTGELGIYQVLGQSADRPEPAVISEFAVNLLAEAESDIRPRPVSLEPTPTAAQASPAVTGQREWWWALGLAGLAILLLEWWVYWRGESR